MNGSTKHISRSLITERGPNLSISFDNVIKTFHPDEDQRVAGLLSCDIYDIPLFQGDRVNGGAHYNEFITTSKNYYLYPAEPPLLHSFAPQVAQIVGRNAIVHDLGPGPRASILNKTMAVLAQLDNVSVYKPIDITPDFVAAAEAVVREKCPNIAIAGEAKNFQKELLDNTGSEKSLIMYLGSTISNAPSMKGWTFMNNPFYEQYLNLLREGSAPEGYLLLTHDCNQNKRSQIESYNYKSAANVFESAGHKIERDLFASQMDNDAIKYSHRWNAPANCVEHSLISNKDQEFMIYDPFSARSALIQMQANVPYGIVNSYKPTVGQMQQKLLASGWEPLAHKIDETGKLATHLCRAIVEP